MTGMIGFVSWDRRVQDDLGSLMPEPGNFFRGVPSTATVSDFTKVCVYASGSNGSVAEHDGHTLAMLGRRSRQYSETDKIVDSFTSEPDATLHKVGSQFALFFADKTRKKVYIATDAFGSFPIYYARKDGTLFFSTDLDTLSNHRSINARLSDQSIYDYLYFSIIPAPSTIYENISRLPLGHLLIFDRTGLACRQWYKPASIDQAPIDGQKKSLRRSLSAAVDSRWIKGRSACFLSGGLDSSTVSGLASQVSDSPVAAYSIGFPESEYDEMPYARIAATQFGLDHRIHYVSASEIHANMSTVLNAIGEPFSNASAISSFVCAKKAVDDGFDNLLAGDGGDELFAGNERYTKQLKLHVFDRLPSMLRSTLTSLNSNLDRNLPAPIQKLSSYIRQASLPFSQRLQYYSFIEQSGYENIFSRRFLNKVEPESPMNHIQQLFDSAPYEDYLKRMLYVDWRITLADNDLRKVRIACDIAGADVQFPMLDSDVVSVSEKIPGTMMMPGGKLRGLYKQSFKDFLPDSILTKPKQGFGVPVGRWMQSNREFRDFVDANLVSLAERDILNPDFLSDTRLAHQTDNAAHFGVVLWTLIVLEMWLQNKHM
jgi:asparagine synthase (glutamine-hydrolysing)